MDDREFIAGALTSVAAALAKGGFDFALAGGLAYSALAFRPQDRVDMDNILSFFGDGLDNGYLRERAKRLGLDAAFRQTGWTGAL